MNNHNKRPQDQEQSKHNEQGQKPFSKHGQAEQGQKPFSKQGQQEHQKPSYQPEAERGQKKVEKDEDER